MKRLIINTLLSALLLASCSDSYNYTNDRIYPEEQSPSFTTTGTTEVVQAIGSTDQTSTYSFTVMKSGQYAASVSLVPWTEEEVEAYAASQGTAYKLLPADAYSLSATQLDFTKANERYQNVTVDFSPSKIAEYVKASPDKTLLLPIRLLSQEGKADEAQTIFITIDMSPTGRAVWRFKVKVVLDKATFDKYYNSDVETVKAKLKERFDDINELYHGKDGNTYFAADLVFEPVFDASCVYDESSEDLLKRGASIRGEYPYLVLMDGCIGDYSNERAHSDYTGLWYNNQEADCTVFYSISGAWGHAYDILGQYSTSEGLAHELGHGRGVLDLYAMEVTASKNKVNGQGFEAVTCMMNMCWGGTQWSEYTQLLINRNRNYTPDMASYHDMYELNFPRNIVVTVKRNGNVMGYATVNIYGSAFYSNSLDATPEFTTRTSSNGTATFATTSLYTPRYASTIDYGVVLIEAKYGSYKGYRFLPLYEPQTAWLKGENNTYAVEIDLQ